MIQQKAFCSPEQGEGISLILPVIDEITQAIPPPESCQTNLTLWVMRPWIPAEENDRGIEKLIVLYQIETPQNGGRVCILGRLHTSNSDRIGNQCLYLSFVKI